MCTPRGAEAEMEIHFEPPFDERFVNLCVFTVERVKPLFSTCVLTRPHCVNLHAVKKKLQKNKTL